MRALVVAFLAMSVAACFHPSEGVCRDGETRACYAGPRGTQNVGACSDGVETCTDGLWQGTCLGDVTPFVEHCNQVDDDCNGIVDDVEEFGEACVGSNDCPGQLQCIGDKVGCVAQRENACGLCGGPDIAGLGDSCSVNGCEGAFVCTSEGTGVECGAAPQNECGVCDGPAVTDLGDICTATAGCAGERVCSQSGTSSTCDCSVNICNDNGSIRPVMSPGVGDLVITEVMPSPSAVADTAGEWFEVTATAAVDLNNLLLDRASDTANPNAVNAFDCIHLNAGDTAVFARNSDPLMNGGITNVAATFSFTLLGGTAGAPGDVRVLSGTTVIDSVTWTSSRDGTALQLDPDSTNAVANDTEANFCDAAATATYGQGDLGTPGTANNQCPIVLQPGECLENGNPRAIMKPATATDLVITEVMANPSAATESDQEWIEITNVGSVSFDLNGLAVDRGTDTAAPQPLITDTNCHPVAPTSLALLARNASSSTNGGLPTPDATYNTLNLVNSTGEVQVVDPTTCAAATPFACTTIYDNMPYGTPANGVSTQVKPGFFTTTGNDSSANRCPAVAPYGDGTNLGTPRLANSCT